MKKTYLNWLVFTVLAAITSVGITSCEKNTGGCIDETGTLKMNFFMMKNGQPYNLDDEFQNVSGQPTKLELIKFYISDVKAIAADDSEVDAKRIAVIDFSNGRTSVEMQVPASDYKGLKFGVGVPVELNGTNDQSFDITEYANDHPLSVFENMYWSWASGYIFFKIEGRVDTSAGSLDHTFLYHVGMDALYRDREFSNAPFAVAHEQSTDFDVVIDVNKIFYNPNDTLDLRTEDLTHTMDNMPLAEKVANNFIEAFEKD